LRECISTGEPSFWMRRRVLESCKWSKAAVMMIWCVISMAIYFRGPMKIGCRKEKMARNVDSL
jgi:hypothetical protein